MSLTSTNTLRLIVGGSGGASGAASDLTGNTLAANVVNSSLKTINSSMSLSEQLSFLQSLGQYKREVFDINIPADLTCTTGTTVWESISSNHQTVSSQITLALPPVASYFLGQYLIVSDAGYNIVENIGSFKISSIESYLGDVLLIQSGSYAIFTPGSESSAGYWVCVGGSPDVCRQISETISGISTTTAMSIKAANHGENNYITDVDWKREITIDIATSTFTWVDNTSTITSFNNGDLVYISGTGTFPTGLLKGINYYIVSVNNVAKTFQVSTTVGGAVVSLSGTQSSTFYVHKSINLGRTVITGPIPNGDSGSMEILKLVDGRFGRSIGFGFNSSVESYIYNSASNLKITAFDNLQLWAGNTSNVTDYAITFRTFNGGGMVFVPHNGGQVKINPIGKISFDGTHPGKAANLGGTIKVDTTTNSNSGAGVTNLTSYTVIGNSLGTNGDYIEFEAWGIFANNANNKQLIALFGGATLIDSTSLAFNNLSWKIIGTIVRTGATTQTATTQLIISGVLLGAVTTNITTTSSPTETLANNITLKCTGQGVSTTDISQNGLIVKWMPVA